ncbi:hypothetical protein BH23BAC4_BH23BAC4_01680 [soil metagenome]
MVIMRAMLLAQGCPEGNPTGTAPDFSVFRAIALARTGAAVGERSSELSRSLGQVGLAKNLPGVHCDGTSIRNAIRF